MDPGNAWNNDDPKESSYVRFVLLLNFLFVRFSVVSSGIV